MKKGDYIYYRDNHGNTCPTIIESVRGNKIKIKNLGGQSVWVKKSNCVLQSEAP
jgi:hypothetical protein